MRRTRGREIALQALYQKELNPGIGLRQINTFLRHRLKNTPTLVDYTKSLIKGVEEHKAELDKRLELVAENWRIDRMPVLDKNILRIGLYEIQTSTDGTPAAVALNEAVNLAKRYGSVQSGKFINGILDQFLPGHPGEFKLGDPLPQNETTEGASTLVDPAVTDNAQPLNSENPESVIDNQNEGEIQIDVQAQKEPSAESV